MYNSNYKSAQNARAPSKEAVGLRTRCWGRRMFGHHLLLIALASEIGSGAAEIWCNDECPSASDGVCDDGGPGAINYKCGYATDCNDCGEREKFVCSGPRDTAELKQRLWGPGSGYDKYSRPGIARQRALATSSASGGFGPPERDEAWAQMDFMSLDNVDQKNQKVTLQVVLRTMWYDWRLAWNTTRQGGCIVPITHEDDWFAVTYSGTVLDDLWQPGLYAENMITETVLQSAVWLSPEGRVTWSRKAEWTLSCPMDFRWMPFDSQKIFARMYSWKYGHADLALSFGKPGKEDSIAIKRDRCFPDNAEWAVVSRGSQQSEGGADYFIIDLRRRSTTAYMTILLPILLVIIAWTSFFITRAAVPARIALTIIALLTLINTTNSTTSSLPPLAGSVWLVDVMTYSLVMVFYANVEYTMVNVLFRIEARLEKVRDKAEKKRREDDLEKRAQERLDAEHAAALSMPPSPPDTPAEDAQAPAAGVARERTRERTRSRKPSSSENGDDANRHRRRTGERKRSTPTSSEKGDSATGSGESKSTTPDSMAAEAQQASDAAGAARPQVVPSAPSSEASESQYVDGVPKKYSEEVKEMIANGELMASNPPSRKGTSPTRASPTQEVPMQVKEHTLRADMMKIGVGRYDRLVLKHNGQMAFKDQHVDIFSRYMVPTVYLTILLVMFTVVPDRGDLPVMDGTPPSCAGAAPPSEL